ncbi:MAG: hypothetical protein A3B99_00615 [Candidatus Yanofskybacteria bacterium RIFCSPHIGHO2_02_FULL_44_12b]|uniref:Methyl-accepting chemotaxis protein n=2 Tax=Candidatus Yanofskyibacteriota TaxID=1752733 RepID=A0A1F8GJB3_9BACT|nr:MAG: hypothetical protein UW79_C0016G0012 [Candidatus Yanofskybacteria bacterium GW2011_GWA2_44_9]OGN05129.1 MAG: hypothetical protein A2659_02215 [Candidatus Yanofskybacteria bacterium RIFCSPHIGHO2_01_FULL_44_24]OGN15982.1 MAG: hypothetical protein A3B99_00615 [Candidatus Yanofskybacteria bacterium RIFCSPHIGHO2_02_FULL_44_12b]OGN25492.1 MAG: hypothetical protein A2925_02055 [Candidatus Yanofskybacteria bacterium RIFCSPLOWO2_01_FULL_44_22]
MTKAKALNGISSINTVLLGLILVLLAYYVVVANSIASGNYEVMKLNDQLFSLSQAGSSLSARMSSLEDIGFLANFAKNNNMIETKNAIYLFENKNVAFQKERLN